MSEGVASHPVFGIDAEDPNDRVHFLRVPDADGSWEYDAYLVAPVEMPDPVATVNEVIERVRNGNPDEYTWDDLFAQLEPLGIRLAQIMDTIEF